MTTLAPIPAFAPAGGPMPPDLDLTLVARRPARLPEATAQFAEHLPVPVARAAHDSAPRASVVVVTYNYLAFTKLCLTSLLANTDVPAYELIVVDNGSTDGSPQWLQAFAEVNPHVRLTLNESNRGFAVANNQGLAAARGDAIVLLNNDTIVPPAWLARLLAHLDDPAVGLVGPVTNRIGNEAEIETAYRTYGEMVLLADKLAREHVGVRFEIPTPCMFCLALRRDALDRIGPLDERFEVGMLEDDDYARRAHAAGYRVVCSEDAFVHHFGQASFGALVSTGEYARLLEANQRRFEEKWGEPWRPYGRRPGSAYRQMIEDVRAAVRVAVPACAGVAVISRGDEALLDLGGRPARHFPESLDGQYAGHYPADGAAALARLEEVKARGAQYLVIPAPAMWWLEYYQPFARRLEQGGAAWRGPGCLIFALAGPIPGNPLGPPKLGKGGARE